MPDWFTQNAPQQQKGNWFDQNARTAPSVQEPEQPFGSALDIGKGAIKGLGSTLNNLGHVVYPDWLAKHITGAPSAEQQEGYFAPTNTAQSLGKGAEQIAEFLVPGGAEERGAAKLAEFAPRLGKLASPVAHMVTSGISSGAVNAAQGGSPLTGALTGAAGRGAAIGAKALAPTLTGVAQGLEAPYEKTGNAILNETQGVFPGSIRRSARNALSELNPKLEEAAKTATTPVPLGPTQQLAESQVQRAFGQNEPRMFKGAKRLANMVTNDLEGNPLPAEVSPYEALELKRGVGNWQPKSSWNPQSANAFKKMRTPVYQSLDKAFTEAVPEAASLNKRISSLIPATEKPKNFFFGHALGPGVGATLGGVGGYRREGVPGAFSGAAEGALAGFAIPAALNTGARLAFSPVTGKLVRPLVGAALQADREDKKEK